MASTGNNGWIKLPRDTPQWILDSLLATGIYINILREARWEDGSIIDDDGNEIAHNQMVLHQRDFARRHRASESAVRAQVERMVCAGIIARDDANNGVLITYLGGEGRRVCAGKCARPAQKPRRSHARAAQQREFLPIIEEYKEIKKEEESARAESTDDDQSDGIRWMKPDEIVL